MNSSSSSSPPSHRIKLSWEGSNEVLSIEPTMTLQQLGAKAKEFLSKANAKTNKNGNPKEKEEDVQELDGTTASSFCLSLSMITTNKTGDVAPAGIQEIEWKSNGQTLVRDIIPNMSLVYCKRIANVKRHQQHKNNESAKQPLKKRPRDTKQEQNDAVVDLISSSDEDDGNDDDVMVVSPPPSKRKKTSSITTALDDPRNPTSVNSPGEYWIWQSGPSPYSHEEVLGKWMVFRKKTTIEKEWNRIAMAVKSGQLHAANSKVSTCYNNTTNPHARSNDSYVICIYTSQQRMIEVGMLLIQLVKHEIRYKTDEATLLGIYGSNSTCQSLYWNNGRPSTERIKWTKSQQVKSAKEAQQVVASISGTSGTSTATAASATTTNDMVPFNKIILTVNGLQHGYYKNNNTSESMEGKAVKLIREPNNSYDKNAIRVDLTATTSTTTTTTNTNPNEKVGYIQKDQAGVLSPWLDRNLVYIQKATIQNVQVGNWNHKSAAVLLKGKAHPNAKEILDRHSTTASTK